MSELETLAQTIPGLVVGTVQYMSPEQALGRPVDQRTDIFSLGVVLYEMTTGRPPFKGATATETIDRILHSEPEPISDRERGGELEVIISKCLQKDRERRYHSADELMVDLQSLRQQLDAGLVLRTRRRFIWRRRSVLIPGAALLIVLALFTVAQYRPTAAKPYDSLAVLPFANASGNPNLEYVADGVAESIIGEIARTTDLKVIARASVFRYKGRRMEPGTIGRDLRVLSVLNGSVLGKEDMLQFNLELADTRDNRHIWGGRYSKRVSELLGLQTQIAQEVSKALSPHTRVNKPVKEHTKDPEAYRLYLLARYHSAKLTRDGLNKAIELFEQAVRRDPSYAPAYLGIARAYHYASGWYFPPREAMPKARQAAAQALQIDDSLSEGHAAIALVRAWYDWDFAGAEAEFRRALELNAGDSAARQAYAWFICAIGRANEAVVELRRSLEFDPQSLELNSQLGWALYMADNEPEAVKQLRHTIDLDPDFWLSRWFLGWIHENEGRIADALVELERARLLDENPELLGELGRVYALAGKTKEAKQILETLQRAQSQAFAPAWAIAGVYAALGDQEKTLEWLNRGYDERFDTMPWVRTDPRFKNLRPDPRFQALAQKLGLGPQVTR